MMGWFNRAIGIAPNDDPKGMLSAFSDDDIRKAALDLIPERLFKTCHTLGENASFYGDTIDQIESGERQIAAARSQFTSLEPPRLRQAVMDWLDRFANNAAAARADLETRASKKRMAEYDRERAIEKARTKTILEKIKPAAGEGGGHAA